MIVASSVAASSGKRIEQTDQILVERTLVIFVALATIPEISVDVEY